MTFRIELSYDEASGFSTYLVTVGRNELVAGPSKCPSDPGAWWAEREARYLAKLHAAQNRIDPEDPNAVTIEIVRR